MSKRHTNTHKIVCWQITRKCNRQCIACLSHSTPNVAHPNRNPEKVVHRLSELGVEKISYSGGEPTIYPLFREALEIGNTLNMHQLLTTNGDTLEGLQEFPKWLDYLQYIKLSFRGTQKTHDQVMGTGHYDKLMSLANRLHETGHIVGANYLLSKQSLSDVENFLYHAITHNIQHILLLLYIPIGKSSVDSSLSLPENTSIGTLVSKKIIRLIHECNMDLKVHDYRHDDFVLVLNEIEHFMFAKSYGQSNFDIGSIWDATLALPDHLERIPIRDALQKVWAHRLTTSGIYTL